MINETGYRPLNCMNYLLNATFISRVEFHYSSSIVEPCPADLQHSIAHASFCPMNKMYKICLSKIGKTNDAYVYNVS